MDKKTSPPGQDNHELPPVTISPERFVSVHAQEIDGQWSTVFFHALYVGVANFGYPDAFLGLWTSSQRPAIEQPLCQGAIDLGDKRGRIMLTAEECAELSPLIPWNRARETTDDSTSAYSMTEYAILQTLRERIAAARPISQEA